MCNYMGRYLQPNGTIYAAEWYAKLNSMVRYMKPTGTLYADILATDMETKARANCVNEPSWALNH